MKHKLLALTLIFLLSTIYLTSFSFVHAAGEGQWIKSYSIQDAQTGQNLLTVTDTGQNTSDGSILPGADLKVTFTINVITSGSGNLKLSTNLLQSVQYKFWEPVTPSTEYNLGPDFSSGVGKSTVEFNWVRGEFTMILYGTVPANIENKPSNVNILSLTGPDDAIPIDQIRISTTTTQGTTFQTLLAQKEAKLQTLKDSGVALGYIQLFSNVIEQSKVESAQGNNDNAIALLNGLNVSNEPAASSTQGLYLPIAGVLGVVAVIFIVMFMRARGKVNYFQLVVEDQIKDLEGLTLRASKVDRSLSSNLDSVKEKLKHLVGV